MGCPPVNEKLVPDITTPPCDVLSPTTINAPMYPPECDIYSYTIGGIYLT
jgi:hypothetical protein